MLKQFEVKNIYIGEYERPPVSLTFEYTWSDQHYTILRDGNYKITAKWAWSRTAAWWLGEWIFSLTWWTVLSIMVGANGWNWNGVKYWFGWSANWWTNAAWWWLSWVFTWGWAITASDSARALVIGWWAGWSSYWTWWAWGWNNWWTWTWSYWTAWAWWTPTWHWSTGNNWSYQFSWWNGSWTYWYGWGWWWRWWNGSIWDGSWDDDKWWGWGSWYVLSTASSKVVTLWWWSAAWNNWVVTIVEIR